ncbi:hypothetical protein LY90DRAFT_409958 [Neocallimastix californiae]|uniref:YMC020W-like alpha/beta hydrolase domain-containing protein n=1 Tax=Neocallimastix californiae TaxID=1754190 RepID=A0A1Y2DDH4_9FUNG|nr:hypothetical protein LY90DRAFT_409958 [Neocallimastix californiae]|eukprot:ORY57332.1 hypothetical protein LY90DRAFT_409958 [Neocallimastix californiae]
MTYNVITYFNDLGIEITNENISQIPLSGEGIVKNRVEALYEQLEKRMDEVRNADIVLFSAHSQGTPVSVFLLNRLLENKEIDTERQTVGMLAMAEKTLFDVSGDAGEELFVFNDPHEQITKYYHAALFNVLNSGVRICAIGSWFDQVVPLYSATLQGINHPNLYRAIYVERRDYHDDFFTSLIEFDMKLRNRGISDYGLLIHLSDLIIGSFVHGTQGHSTIYESDNMVMGMRMSKFKALHKLDVILEQLQSMHIHRFKSPKTLNTYYIPWIISNLQHSNKIKDDPELLDDLKHLMIQYSEWHPTSKSLKLLKERLAPIQELFKVADINITPEDIKRIKEAKAKQQQQQQQQYYSQYESPYDPPFSSSTSSSSSSSTTTTTTTTTTTAEKVPYNDQEAIHEINDILFRGEEDEEE